MDPMGKETFFHISWSRRTEGICFFSFQASVRQFAGKSMRKMYVVCDMFCFLPMKRNNVMFNMLLFFVNLVCFHVICRGVFFLLGFYGCFLVLM